MPKRLVVTKHDDYVIVYADMFVLNETFDEVLREIYFFEGRGRVMYAFFRGRALIFSDRERTTSNEMKLAGDFTRLQRPVNPVKYSSYSFDPEEKELSLEMVLNREAGPKTAKQLSGALDMYFSDLWRISTTFDVIFI